MRFSCCTLVSALLLVAAVCQAQTPVNQQTAVPSSGFVTPTETVNSHLPAWIRLSGEVRLREEGFLGRGFQAGQDDMYLLNRVRLGVQIQPTPWLRLFAQGQDSRVFFNQRLSSGPPVQDRLDLRQAYAEFGSIEKGALALRVGRQELAFGEERLVGAGNWGNIARSFDAARLTLHHSGYRLDAFASTVVVPNDHAFDHHTAGDDLHGLYGSIEKWVPKGKIEPYFFWHLAPRYLGEAGQSSLDSRTVGLRWAGSLPYNFEYTLEAAKQFGHWGRDPVRAWAGFGRLGHTWTHVRYQPRLLLETNYATGDRNPRDGQHNTFDVLYPTPHDKYGLADQVGWKNVEHVGVILEAKPRKQLTLQTKVHNWWLASASDGLYNSGGALIVRASSAPVGRHVGWELDAQAVWAKSSRMQIGLGLGHLFPGTYLEHTTPGRSYTFPYVSVVSLF